MKNGGDINELVGKGQDLRGGPDGGDTRSTIHIYSLTFLRSGDLFYG
jgi:hypothetical protein